MPKLTLLDNIERPESWNRNYLKLAPDPAI